jgi:hypothetical protein
MPGTVESGPLLPPAIVEALLAHVGGEWRRFPREERPWGVWVREHGALPPGTTLLARPTPVRRVWFVDAAGVRAMDPWAYARFHAVHALQPWCQRRHGEPDALFSERVHRIAQAAFAPYLGADDLYLERLWGSRWAVGERVSVDANGAVHAHQNLWVS